MTNVPDFAWSALIAIVMLCLIMHSDLMDLWYLMLHPLYLRKATNHVDELRHDIAEMNWRLCGGWHEWFNEDDQDRLAFAKYSLHVAEELIEDKASSLALKCANRGLLSIQAIRCRWAGHQNESTCASISMKGKLNARRENNHSASS